MQIPSEQVIYKKQIGKLGDVPIWELGLMGGLHLVVAARKGKAETLGVGPHRAVARHIAMKREPSMTVTELSKSDYYDPAHFQHLVPRYEAMSAAFREAQGLED